MSLTAEQKKQLQQIKGFDTLRAEYEKQMKGSGKMKGRGWWDDLWNGIKKTAGDVNKFLKDTKIISKTGKLAKVVLPFIPAVSSFADTAGTIGNAAESLGYGKRKKRVVKGGGLTAMPITAGTKKKPTLKTVISDKMTLSQNGQFQQVPKLVGSGDMRGSGGQLDVSPSTYNMISTNTKMKIKK